MATTVNLLGEVREFRGGQVANLGQWLVVFKHNKPVSLYSTGVKVRKLFNAPTLGANVASLDTTPQEIAHQVRDVRTKDNYNVPSFTVHLQARLTPEELGAPQNLLERIMRDGPGFFDSIEADIRKRIERQIRDNLGSATALGVLTSGPMEIAFPTGELPLLRPEVEITSIQGIDWEEGHLARDVREARERDVADRDREKLEQDARERQARALIHQQQLDAEYTRGQHAIDAELAQAQLEVALSRAKALGLDPMAIAEPDIWLHVSQQHSDVLTKLLESTQIYPMLRTSPDLMRAIIDRLAGSNATLRMSRQADMVLDGVDPQRVLTLQDATIHSTKDSSEYLHRAGLVVDPLIEDAWKRAGGNVKLEGAGYATDPTQTAAIVLIVATPEPSVPPLFADVFQTALQLGPHQVTKVGVYVAQGRTLIDAVDAFVRRISPDVHTNLVLRQTNDRREALVNLDGPTEAVRTVYKTMTDPSNPILPALESLVGNRAQIRFALPEGVGR